MQPTFLYNLLLWYRLIFTPMDLGILVGNNLPFNILSLLVIGIVFIVLLFMK